MNFSRNLKILCFVCGVILCGAKLLADNVQVTDDSLISYPHPSATPCFSGDRLAKAIAAENLLQKITGITFNKVRADFDMSSIYKGSKLTEFYVELAQAVKARNCVFDKGNVKVDSYVHVIQALAYHSYKIEPTETIPEWLKPGKFIAVLAGSDSDNEIVITLNKYGFVFHKCEADPNTYGSKPPPPTSHCPPLMNSVAFVPVDQFLKNTTGFDHFLMTTLKAFGSIGLIVTSNLSYALASPVAQTALAVANPTPLSDYEMEYEVDKVVQQTVEMGNLRDQKRKMNHKGYDNNTFLVTRWFPNMTYAELKSGLRANIENILTEDFSKLDALKHDPTNMYEIDSAMMIQEREFRYDVEQQRLKVHAARAHTTTGHLSTAQLP